jgi:hypothetical protein
MTEKRQPDREATPAEIAAFDRGEQKVWRCPKCGDECEVLSAVMVFCGPCRDERRELVPMKSTKGE